MQLKPFPCFLSFIHDNVQRRQRLCPHPLNQCENVIRLTFRLCTDKSHNSDIFLMRWPCLIMYCFLMPLLSQSHCLLAAIYTFQMIFNLQSERAGLAALCHFLPPFTFLHLLQSISLRLSNSSFSVFLPQAFISTGCFYQ